MRRFQVVDAAAVAGEGIQYSDGTVAIHGRETGSTYYSSAEELMTVHPYWAIHWIDGVAA